MDESDAVLSPQYFDLSALAASVKGDKSLKSFAGVISSASSAYSARLDLGMSVECCTQAMDLIKNNSVVGPTKEIDLHLNCLISQAIILYARATKTSSYHRLQVDVHQQFTKEQLSDHQEFCGLRDDAIAHYGKAKHSDGIPWIEEKVLLITSPESTRTSFIAKRFNVSKALVQRVLDHVSVAFEILTKISQQRGELINKRLRDTLDNNPSFLLKLHKFIFDPTDFVGLDNLGYIKQAQTEHTSWGIKGE